MSAKETTEAEREVWRQRVRRQRESGMTEAEYARATGISVETLRAWRKRLHGGVAERVRITLPERNCPQCGRMFAPRRADKRYCSVTCRLLAQKLRARAKGIV